MVAHSEDSGATWSAPQPLRIDADVNDDGLVTAADSAAVKAGTVSAVRRPITSRLSTSTSTASSTAATAALSKGWLAPRFRTRCRRCTRAPASRLCPSTGALYLAWRHSTSRPIPTPSIAARSTDGGVTFSSPALVSPLNPFDQGTSTTSFRTNAYPSLTVDGDGRGYLAFVTRGLAQDRDPIEGRRSRGGDDARRMASRGRHRHQSTTTSSAAISSCRRSPSRPGTCSSSTTTSAKTCPGVLADSSTSRRSLAARRRGSGTRRRCGPRQRRQVRRRRSRRSA